MKGWGGEYIFGLEIYLQEWSGDAPSIPDALNNELPQF
jgi:hypothetical protein